MGTMFEVNENTFYTVNDLSKGLGFTINAMRGWIRNGRLKASKVGRNYVVSGKELKVFLTNGTSDNIPSKKPRKRKK